MMPIKQKLKSENGASFLLALLAFLVAAMVCVTIITAATSSVKRVHSDRESQQMQLAITSAAQLVRDTMGETQYCITTVTTTENGNAITYKTGLDLTETAREKIFYKNICEFLGITV